MKAMIIITNGVEECEALITYDLLYRAGINVDLVGIEDDVKSSHEIMLKTNININDVNSKEYDCLILPGGMPGTLNLENNTQVQKIIDEFVESNKLIAAICAAPSILIHKGLLNNSKFVCFPGFENGLMPADGKAIQDKNFITGKGLGAAFDFSYLIISNLLGNDKAKEVLDKIQY